MDRPARQRHWAAVIADFRRSGLTQAEFCRRRHVSIHAFRSRLYSPRHRFPPPGTPGTPNSLPRSTTARCSTPSFLPVHIRPHMSVPVAHHDFSKRPTELELVVGDEHLIRIPTGFDPATLGRLLDLLESRS
jgi:hypothetical protein